MRKPLRTKTGSLLASSDLTVVAPIKPGLIPALDTVTYKTRVKTVLRALHLGRTVSHESDLARVMSDAVERVGRIHSARVAVIEPQDVVLLAVTFDGSRDAYIRTIWQKVARLLDLIFCNTVGHVPGATHSYEEWADWIRRHQVEVPFAYGTPGVTTDDLQYHRMHERLALRKAPPAGELDILRATIPSAEEIADKRSRTGVDPTNTGFVSHELLEPETEPPAFHQGMRALVGLYRLADWYPPGSEDGRFLLRAAQELLPEFTRLLETDVLGIGRANERARIKEALDWFRDGRDLEASSRRRQRPPPAELKLFQPETVQAGILQPLEDCGHGVIALIAIPTAAGWGPFLDRARPSTLLSEPPEDRIRVNLALTIDGLRSAGLTEDELARLPEAFLHGMARRAGLLGDVRINHPSNWRLPVRNWSLGIAAPDLGDEPAERIELEAVHVILQLRLCNPDADEATARQLLMARLTAMVGDEGQGLSLQWLRRLRDPQAQPANQVVEHFGFGDGLSDPVFRKDEAGRRFANHVHVGEALVGYGNSADEPPYPETSGPPPGSFAELLHNGSYLVIRKLRQDVPLLDEAVAATTQASAVDGDTVLAKMMGRWPARHAKANQPLVGSVPGRINDFNYRGDREGKGCPFHAHIRRANPRSLPDAPLIDALAAGRRAPRLFRRSLSYGQPYERDPAAATTVTGAQAERGLVFMAYNGSLAEQFEVIQSWLSGGNSSDSLSVPDPFVGVAEAGSKRHYRFEIDKQVVRVPLDGSDALHDEPRPLVRLEWGVYAFTPSTTGLELLKQRAGALAKDRRLAAAARVPWSVAAGRAAIEQLRQIEREQGEAAALLAWKTALEDAEESAEFRSAAIWAAIRSDHGGVLRTPYGVLIGSREQVQRWMSEEAHAVSVAGYMPRMRNSFGPIFLGMDAGPDYQREVEPALKGIAQLADPFDRAFQCTQEEIDRLAGLAKKFAEHDEALRRAAGGPPIESVRWEATIDLRELVDHMLATFCEDWYGLSQTDGHLARGGFSWAWRYGDPARYPGHFMAPSRAFFQPHPGLEVEQTGSLHGQALARSVKSFLRAFGETLKAQKPALAAVLDSEIAQDDPDYATRTVIGMIMGFVPTVDGVLRRALAQWGNDGTLWALRAARGAVGEPQLQAQVALEFTRAMQLRTMPESLWRTATRSFRLEGEGGANAVDVAAGDALIFGLMSATQECLSVGDTDTTLSFSGDRSAARRPTHACPGRDLAMRMMLGFVQALVQSVQPLRPGAAPSTFAVEGRSEMPAQPAAPNDVAAALVGVRPVSKAKIKRRKQHGVGYGRAGQQVLKAGKEGTVPFWAVGDSWLDNLAGPFPDLVTSLGQLGYEVTDSKLRHANKGFPLAHLAEPGFLAQLQQDFSDAQQGIGSELPEFIILGGGGNDIVGQSDRPDEAPLFGMLIPGATRPADAVDPGALQRFLRAMKGHYLKILEVLCTSAPGTPIFIHAYDHPIPDDRGFLPEIGPGPWLNPLFERAKLTDLAVNIDVMRALIDALNDMVDVLAQEQRDQGRPVHHLRLAGVLASAKNFGNPKTDRRYRAYWHDELHPEDKGCDALADAVVVQLAAAGVRKPGA